MSSFTKLTVTHVDGNIWETDKRFTYYVGKEGSSDKITVPKGFKTDFASVPWPASMLITKSGKYNPAAVIHDYLYTIKDRTRAEADKIFLEAMEVLGVPLWKRRLMYRAVRVGGWLPWRTKKNEEIPKVIKKDKG